MIGFVVAWERMVKITTAINRISANLNMMLITMTGVRERGERENEVSLVFDSIISYIAFPVPHHLIRVFIYRQM